MIAIDRLDHLVLTHGFEVVQRALGPVVHPGVLRDAS
jgi:hypothetical protein